MGRRPYVTTSLSRVPTGRVRGYGRSVATFRLHEITVDCNDVVRVGAFWAELLGGSLTEPLPGWRRLPAADGRPMLNFQPVPEPKRGKARVHLDLVTDDLAAAIAEVVSLGGHETGERHEYDEGTVVVLADPEGTEFCVVQYVGGRT